MAQTIGKPEFQVMITTILLFNFMILFQSTAISAATNHSTVSFRLFHSSFFFSRNLTDMELLHSFVESSKSYAESFEQSTFEGNTTAIRPPVTRTRFATYLVSFSLGTGRGSQPYNLVMDTGSSLTWTQCEPCHPRYPQETPLFDPNLSPSYRFIPCNDPLCVHPYRCVDGKCHFENSYGFGRVVVSGTLSKETFTFRSSSRQSTEAINDVIFGCTHDSRGGPLPGGGQTAGLLGLDRAGVSFAAQMARRTGDGRFSYCFTRPGVASSGDLRFGADVRIRLLRQTTRFVTYPDVRNRNRYWLKLKSISLNGRDLHIASSTFERKADGSGGVVIDSGSPFSMLIDPAYAIVKAAIQTNIFRRYHLLPHTMPELNLDLCYQVPNVLDLKLPSITLKFRGARLQLGSEKLFWFNPEQHFFCLAIHRSPTITILGAYQQSNTRFVYDLDRGQLSFASDNCALDSRSLMS